MWPLVWAAGLAAVALALVLAGPACTSVLSGADVFALPEDDIRPPQLLFRAEEGLERGYFPELQKYLEGLPRE